MKDREHVLLLDFDVRVLVRRSSRHPPEYAIVLMALRNGRWRTVRTYDNAHRVEEHHEHRYAGDTKLPPSITHGPVNKAMSAAESAILDGWRTMVDEWEQAAQA